MNRNLAPTCLVVGFYLLTLAAFVPALNAQAKTDEAVWHRYSTSAGDLTFAFPGTDILIDQDGPTTWVLYAKGGLSLSVRADRTKGAKKRFMEIAELPSSKEYKGFTLDDFYGLWNRDTDATKGTDYVYFQLASKHGLYGITGRSRDGQNADLERFLRSIRLGGKQLVNTEISKESEAESVTMIEGLPTSEKVAQALKRTTPKELRYTRSSAKQDSVKVESGEGVDSTISPKHSSNLTIIRKPRPKRAESGRQPGFSGTVRFRATFRADGTIGPVELLQSIDRGFDDRAFEALKGIKFIPAEIDGKPVDVTRTIEYTFSVY